MAKRLPEAERKRLAADFDPPPAPQAHHHDAPPLTAGKRTRVTASLTPEQYEMLKKLAKRHGRPMSRMLGMAVEAMYDN